MQTNNNTPKKVNIQKVAEQQAQKLQNARFNVLYIALLAILILFIYGATMGTSPNKENVILAIGFFQFVAIGQTLIILFSKK